MIGVDEIPAAAIEAARLAMAEALANDGDGIPECIAAAVSAWPGAHYLPAHPNLQRIVLPITEPANDN